MPYIDLGSVVGPQGEQGATGAQGIRGEQGLPGPNQVTNSTATPLTGVLTGNGSVVGVTSVDAAPTDESTNLVSSGGVKTALDAKANPSQIAYAETGTTASKAYVVGEYFCLNGTLYQATESILAGSTITPGTNCQQRYATSVYMLGDYPNGMSITAVPNGYYRIIPNHVPAEGFPTGFSDYAVLSKFRMGSDSGYIQAIMTDVYGRLAVWSTQNQAWAVH